MNWRLGKILSISNKYWTGKSTKKGAESKRNLLSYVMYEKLQLQLLNYQTSNKILKEKKQKNKKNVKNNTTAKISII